MANDAKKTEVAPQERPITRDELLEALKQSSQDTLLAAIQLINQQNEAKNADFRVKSKEQLELAQAKLETCVECKQKRSACKGRHRKVRVLPSLPRHAQFFQGIIINGVKYLSSYQDHMVTVPEDANIEGMVAVAEAMEEEIKNGKEHVYNSGSIGKGGQYKQHWSGFRAN